ncbi:MAG TPA: hypothetical protein VKZ75_01025 [Cyclobacteriaceae bacterium]|nr:hypothetical protein [Cyclobacteriaceae bacterium]
MQELRDYLQTVLGLDVTIQQVNPAKSRTLPFYLKEGFKFYTAVLLGRELLFVQPKGPEPVNASRVQKQLENIRALTSQHPVLLTEDLPATIRNRLIRKGIDFIVPFKQMFLPSLLIDLRQTFKRPKPHAEALLPSAQVILLYRILNKSSKIEELRLKDLAKELGYSAMAITKAAENLYRHKLCIIKGTKERHLHFNLPSHELWDKAKPLLVDPVLRRVYIDDYPKVPNIVLVHAGLSALSDYTDINHGTQECRAIEKGQYYSLQKSKAFHDLNEYEGRITLEIWKYDPAILARMVMDSPTADPLSLYLSLRYNRDERVQIALEQLVEQNLW